MSKRIIGLVILLVAIIFLMVLFAWNYTRPSRKADVAIYSGGGIWEDSVRAIEEMFHWMNYTVELVSAEYINNNELEAFRILCVPGGNMYDYAQDISSKGKENVRDFVHGGGGYIGICGGAYFAAEKVVWRGSQLSMTPLGLFAGTATGPINEIMPYPNYTMCNVNIINHMHFITQSEQDPITTLYYWGPALVSNADANVTILGNYDKGNQAAIVVFEYFQGRVFLMGAHPEIEEDSDRDKVIFADEFNDEGSEWDLMQKAVFWLLEES
jgi:biotin--protein ligase